MVLPDNKIAETELGDWISGMKCNSLLDKQQKEYSSRFIQAIQRYSFIEV